MANIFKRKRDIDEQQYDSWDELEAFGEEQYEEEEFYEEETVYEDEVEEAPAYEEEEYYSEEQEAAYASGAYVEGEEEYYEDEEYYEEEEEYYEDEEYMEEDNEDDEEGGFFSNMSFFDKLLTFGSAALVVVAVFIAGYFILNQPEPVVENNYLAVGSQLQGIDVIGESGLLAVAGQEQNRLQAIEDALHGDDNPSYNENEYNDEVTVNMTLTSIEKDLKIKFTNKKSGKLIGNVPFSVEVTDVSGQTSMWSDDDMDGIIHKKKLTPGQYKVTALALDGEKYDKYDLPQATNKVEVKEEIVIQKVDVSNEVKTESEVDVSQEDTAKKDTEVEGYLKDTVEWVDSTVKEATYVEISKDKIEVPAVPVASTGFFSLKKLFTGAGLVSGGDPSPSPSPSPSASPEPTLAPGKITLDTTEIVMEKDKNATVKIASVSGFLPEEEIVYSISSANGAVATASISKGIITIYAHAEGETVVTVMANYKNNGTKETQAIAKIDVKVGLPKILLHILELDVYANMEDEILVFIENATVEQAEYKFEVESSNTAVATATIDQKTRKVTVKGVAAGTAEITVTYIEGDVKVSKTCKINVLNSAMTDTTTKLVTKDGKQQLYVYDGTKYREAVSADYYTYTKFYVLSEAKYTGWQTIKGDVYFFDASGNKVTGEQVIQGVKYNFASDGSLVTGSGIMGIDVSKWNGDIDWKAVKNSGVSYVIIRCGYRGSTKGALIEDAKFHENIKGATNAGLKVGVYFFTQAIDNAEALEEASMVLDMVKKYRISYPIFLDVEAGGGRADSITKEERTAVCKTFCETIEKYGYTAGIYANKTWLSEKIDVSALSKYKIWLAQYASTPTYSGRYDMWQYKDTGKVSGISGNVDLNMSYLGY